MQNATMVFPISLHSTELVKEPSAFTILIRNEAVIATIFDRVGDMQISAWFYAA